MKKRVVAVLVAGVIAFPTAGTSSARVIRSTVAAHSTAAPSFDNCDQMHTQWRYGVAKSRRAARRQVNSGHYRPRVSRSGYRANRSLDADSDGTACEVSL
jgi:hypothetical protein